MSVNVIISIIISYININKASVDICLWIVVRPTLSVKYPFSGLTRRGDLTGILNWLDSVGGWHLSVEGVKVRWDATPSSGMWLYLWNRG